ncbi:hypothetical protein [Terrabacter sp. NPDC080008]|uniref:hypothetical protein n=1 Tax=Terrabacter sp. NPDC080008 TaxID=3155176 RepID=UPI00344BB802
MQTHQARGDAPPASPGRPRRRRPRGHSSRAASVAAGLLLAATGALAACGTSTSSPGLPADPGMPGSAATTAPVAPAPPDFAGRAAVVAEAVRRAGVPTPPSVPVLLSGWALDLGFDTSEQKIAWNARNVEVAPGVPAHATGSGTMTSGRTTRPVRVIGPRDSLDRALRADSEAPGSCDGVPAASCRLVVTRAERADAVVRTNTGGVRVPVWRLTIDGLSHPISVVAVGDGVLQWELPGSVRPLPGLPEAPLLVHPADRLIAVNGATVDVGIGGGPCDVGLAAHVVELDDMVVVGGTSQPNPRDTACPASYISRSARLQLVRRLGSRPVIDAVSGRLRILGVPAY